MSSDSESYSDEEDNTRTQFRSSTKGSSSSLGSRSQSTSSSSGKNEDFRQWVNQARKQLERRENANRKQGVKSSDSSHTSSPTESTPDSQSQSKTGYSSTYLNPSTIQTGKISSGQSEGGQLDSRFSRETGETQDDTTIQTRNQTETTPTSQRTTYLRTTPIASEPSRTKVRESSSRFDHSLSALKTSSTSEETHSSEIRPEFRGDCSEGIFEDVTSNSLKTKSSGDISSSRMQSRENEVMEDGTSVASDSIEPRHSVSRRTQQMGSSSVSQRERRRQSSNKSRQSDEYQSDANYNYSAWRRSNAIRPRRGIPQKHENDSLQRKYSAPAIKGLLPSDSNPEDIPFARTRGHKAKDFRNEISGDFHERGRFHPSQGLTNTRNRCSSQQRLAEKIEGITPPQVSAQVKHCFFPEAPSRTRDPHEPCGYKGCDPPHHPDEFSDCDEAIARDDVRFMRAKMIKLEDTLELMYKKFKLHEDNIDEMQERLYLYEFGTPGTFMAVIRFYFAILTCTVVPLLIVEAFYRMIFGFSK